MCGTGTAPERPISGRLAKSNSAAPSGTQKTQCRPAPVGDIVLDDLGEAAEIVVGEGGLRALIVDGQVLAAGRGIVEEVGDASTSGMTLSSTKLLTTSLHVYTAISILVRRSVGNSRASLLS